MHESVSGPRNVYMNESISLSRCWLVTLKATADPRAMLCGIGRGGICLEECLYTFTIAFLLPRMQAEL